MSTWVGHHKADGADTSVIIPYLTRGEQLYVTNVGTMDLKILPKSHEPIPPGETRLYERHPSGTGVLVTHVHSAPNQSSEPQS